MATGFSTRSGLDGYRLNFDTDNLDYYLLMQKIARHCVGGKPAADVVEVVRCDHCERRYEEDGEYFCGRTDMPCADDDFCSYGERKEDEHEAD